MDSSILLALRVCTRMERQLSRTTYRYISLGSLKAVHQTAQREQKPTSPTSSGFQNKQSMKLESKPPEHRDCDWIGPPNPDSNLRPRKYYIPEDETGIERDYRLRLEETARWNHNFWAAHNKSFAQGKERFIQLELARLGPVLEDGSPRRLTPEQLSVFYKSFLTEKYNHHKDYNRDWYKRNIKLLWPAFKVMCIRMLKNRK